MHGYQTKVDALNGKPQQGILAEQSLVENVVLVIPQALPPALAKDECLGEIGHGQGDERRLDKNFKRGRDDDLENGICNPAKDGRINVVEQKLTYLNLWVTVLTFGYRLMCRGQTMWF